MCTHGCAEDDDSQIYPELARLQEGGLIEHTDSGPRGSKTYALTDRGLEEVRRWLRETEPDRRVRNDAALRLFFLWLLEPEVAGAQLERELEYWLRVLFELEAIGEEAPGPTRKEKAFRLALEGGIRTVEARVAWARVGGRRVGTRVLGRLGARPHASEPLPLRLRTSL